MLAAVLVLAGIALGCLTIILSVAFAIAARDKLHDEAYALLISASAFMALAVCISVTAGRFI